MNKAFTITCVKSKALICQSPEASPSPGLMGRTTFGCGVGIGVGLVMVFGALVGVLIRIVLKVIIGIDIVSLLNSNRLKKLPYVFNKLEKTQWIFKHLSIGFCFLCINIV